MLTKPEHGWTEFSLEGAPTYTLSDLDDIALEWTAQAIHGLETMLPFCVKGFMEPRRMLCTVSYWNCHITVEDEERSPLKLEYVSRAYSHTSMLEFCKNLHEDLSSAIDEWADFMDYSPTDFAEKKRTLEASLQTLKALITEKAEFFDANHCFL